MSYQNYKEIFKNYAKPLAFLDRDLLDQNINDIISRNPHKKMRLASKSIRCLNVLKYILNSSKQFEGIMSFTGEEALFLLENGFDNILLGYPIINKNQIAKLCEYINLGKNVVFMTDLPEHVALINEIAKEKNVIAKICIDMDMSSQFPFLYFGVYRSSIKTISHLKAFTNYVKLCENIHLTGLMGYESQIAGVGDKMSDQKVKSQLIRLLKKKSIKEVKDRRGNAVAFLKNNGFDINLVNAGGTGSLESSAQEDWVTEITVGSGFYSSHLFDSYKNFRHKPAVAYMLDIVRNPEKGIFTASGGGYTASGSIEPNKLPKPYLPDGVKLFKNEGVGEVQTPFKYTGTTELKVGDPLIMRHSKAGEVCERFNQLYVVSQGKIIDEYPTYRGQGKCFM